jgi:NADPH2:quinone reductase
VRVDVRHRWPLAQAADAHRALEGRKTTGSVILTP